MLLRKKGQQRAKVKPRKKGQPRERALRKEAVLATATTTTVEPLQVLQALPSSSFLLWPHLHDLSKILNNSFFVDSNTFCALRDYG